MPAATPANAAREVIATKLFYGRRIVGGGMVVTCIGLGTMLSPCVFLRPGSMATGRSLAGISTVAILDSLSLGAASFAWGAPSD